MGRRVIGSRAVWTYGNDWTALSQENFLAGPRTIANALQLMVTSLVVACALTISDLVGRR